MTKIAVLAWIHTIMVSKVSHKNFEVCATKRHKPRNFEVQKFRCAFGCTYLIFCAQTRFTRVVLQKKICWPAGRLNARIPLSWCLGSPKKKLPFRGVARFRWPQRFEMVWSSNFLAGNIKVFGLLGDIFWKSLLQVFYDLWSALSSAKIRKFGYFIWILRFLSVQKRVYKRCAWCHPCTLNELIA